MMLLNALLDLFFDVVEVIRRDFVLLVEFLQILVNSGRGLLAIFILESLFDTRNYRLSLAAINCFFGVG